MHKRGMQVNKKALLDRAVLHKISSTSGLSPARFWNSASSEDADAPGCFSIKSSISFSAASMVLDRVMICALYSRRASTLCRELQLSAFVDRVTTKHPSQYADWAGPLFARNQTRDAIGCTSSQCQKRNSSFGFVPCRVWLCPHLSAPDL